MAFISMDLHVRGLGPDLFEQGGYLHICIVSPDS